MTRSLHLAPDLCLAHAWYATELCHLAAGHSSPKYIIQCSTESDDPAMRARLLLCQEVKGACCSWSQSKDGGRDEGVSKGACGGGVARILKQTAVLVIIMLGMGNALRWCVRIGMVPHTCSLPISCESTLGGNLHDLLGLL